MPEEGEVAPAAAAGQAGDDVVPILFASVAFLRTRLAYDLVRVRGSLLSVGQSPHSLRFIRIMYYINTYYLYI